MVLPSFSRALPLNPSLPPIHSYLSSLVHVLHTHFILQSKSFSFSHIFFFTSSNIQILILLHAKLALKMTVPEPIPPVEVESTSHLTSFRITSISQAPRIKDLDASEIFITKTTSPRPVPEPNSKEVWASKNCTDHMITVRWTADEGWHTPEIKPVISPLFTIPIFFRHIW